MEEGQPSQGRPAKGKRRVKADAPTDSEHDSEGDHGSSSPEGWRGQGDKKSLFSGTVACQECGSVWTCCGDDKDWHTDPIPMKRLPSFVCQNCL